MEIVRRRDWGAADRQGHTHLPAHRIKELYVHYTASHADMGVEHARCASRVRGIQRFHQETRGWDDIAYNWIFCRHGYVFEGRGWLTYPAATYGQNHRSQAICFLGADTKRDDVTVKGRKAAAFLVNEFFHVCGPGDVRPHSAAVSTSCPGDELRAWVAAKGFLTGEHERKPWPIPIPHWFWLWAKWRRERFTYPSYAAWMRARPKSAPIRIPKWAWVRLAAMGGA